MGIISPKKQSAVSKPLMAFLVLIFSPILLGAILFYLLWGAILYIALWITWKRQFVVFVYSDSPIWKDYIEREILPYLQDRTVILNWSERRNWKNSLAVLAFRYFGGHRNFNPMGMVFPPFRFVKTYRFYEAFKEYKHGHSNKVENLKRALLKEVGI
jgi:hypothetical protein